MNDTLKLLENRNFWFQKYLACNEAYATALQHAPDLAIDELNFFYGNRESLLRIISKIDNKIQSALNSKSILNSEANSEQRTKINYYIREKDSILNRILELDQIIIARLETAQIEYTDKLQQMNKGKKALAKYKSSNKYNEKIDKQV